MSITLALTLLLCSACASTPEAEPPFSEAQSAALLAGHSILDGEPLPTVEDADILGMNPGMQAFVDSHVDPYAPMPTRLDQLVNAVIEDESFGLNYEGQTRTAGDTFQYRNGNCLAFTNMFVAMARAADLEATFQEVDIPPVWDRQGDTIILNRHVNVNVKNVKDRGEMGVMMVWSRRPERDRVIDFNITEFRTFFDTELISDERAFAHYYSNLGAESVRDGSHAMALAYLRKSLDYDPGFAAAWTNLGVLYSRAGDLAMAKLAYERSLYYEEDNVTTRSNLASVLMQSGETGRAEALLQEVESYRNRNPYFRFHLATEAVGEGNYEEALAHLKYAVRKQPQEERFHFALSVVYTAMGDYKKAEVELSEAKALAANPLNRQRYDAKLRQLRISTEESALIDS